MAGLNSLLVFAPQLTYTTAVNGRQDQEQRTCDHCGKPFAFIAAAPHKRFCSATCKGNFHKENRRAGEAARMALKGVA